MSDDLLRSLVREVLEEISKDEEKKDAEGDGEIGRPRKDPTNRLAHWLDSHQDGVKKMQRATGRKRATIDKWARGDVTPPLVVAKDIEDMTNIPMDYWVNT